MATSCGKRSLKHKLSHALASTEKTKKPRLVAKKSKTDPKSSSSKNDSGIGSSVSNKKKPVKEQPKKSKGSAKRRLDHSNDNDQFGPINTEEMDVDQILALGEGTSSNTDLPPLREFTSDSDDSEFEEVADTNNLKEPVIPVNGVDITLEGPLLSFKRKKPAFDLEGEVRRQLKRRQKQIQELKHKVHLVCWVAHIKYVNSILNSENLLIACQPFITSKNLYPPKHADLGYLERIVKTFRKNIGLKSEGKIEEHNELESQLCAQFVNKTALSEHSLALMFIVFLRSLGLKVRLIVNVVAVSLKPESNESIVAVKKEKVKEESKCDKVKVESKTPVEPKKSPLKETLKKNLKAVKASSKTVVKPKAGKKKVGNVTLETDSDDEPLSKHFREPRKTKKKDVKVENKKGSTSGNKKKADSDDDFAPKKLVTSKKKIDRRVLSTDEEDSKCGTSKKQGVDVWIEVFLEAEEKWITVDIIKQKIHCVQLLYSKATHPVIYVLACNNDSTIKDVTRRYVPNWHSDTRKKRVSETWWQETLWPYLPPNSAREREEDEDIAKQLHDMPLPTSIGEYKCHPLYALKRHLLKFEGIYPPEAPTLGFVRGEPVYARECVVTLRSREIWFKEARIVRANETPYKVVKARPKYDRMTGEFKKDLPLEVFGVWQTEDYVPPTAKDGKVPRNEYGNVDLFKPCMLPGGTVHLQIPALNRVARKLNIDCAPATVGFDFHSGGSHPVFDGFVVCEEFKHILVEAWSVDFDESARRTEEKRFKRVYGNWRRLIRGLFIRENLKAKYAFGENSDDEQPPPATSSEEPPPPPKKKKGKPAKK